MQCGQRVRYLWYVCEDRTLTIQDVEFLVIGSLRMNCTVVVFSGIVWCGVNPPKTALTLNTEASQVHSLSPNKSTLHSIQVNPNKSTLYTISCCSHC